MNVRTATPPAGSTGMLDKQTADIEVCSNADGRADAKAIPRVAVVGGDRAAWPSSGRRITIWQLRNDAIKSRSPTWKLAAILASIDAIVETIDSWCSRSRARKGLDIDTTRRCVRLWQQGDARRSSDSSLSTCLVTLQHRGGRRTDKSWSTAAGPRPPSMSATRLIQDRALRG